MTPSGIASQHGETREINSRPEYAEGLLYNFTSAGRPNVDHGENFAAVGHRERCRARPLASDCGEREDLLMSGRRDSPALAGVCDLVHDSPEITCLQNKILDDPIFGAPVRFALSCLVGIHDLTVVDMACGDGPVSVFLALHGAKVIGFDKRLDALVRARDRASRFEVQDRCMFVGSCSEQMAIHAGTADIVFSRSTLQYMDRTLALAECLRILKPGGTLLLIENLPYNPFVNVYRLLRRLTARRPEDIGYARSIRGYLTFREIETLRSMFSTVERCEFHLCRMVTHSLAETFRNSTWLQAMDAKAAVLDEHLLTHISGMKYFSWVVSVAGKGKFRMDLPSRGDLKDDRRRVTWE